MGKNSKKERLNYAKDAIERRVRDLESGRRYSIRNGRKEDNSWFEKELISARNELYSLNEKIAGNHSKKIYYGIAGLFAGVLLFFSFLFIFGIIGEEKVLFAPENVLEAKYASYIEKVVDEKIDVIDVIGLERTEVLRQKGVVVGPGISTDVSWEIDVSVENEEGAEISFAIPENALNIEIINTVDEIPEDVGIGEGEIGIEGLSNETIFNETITNQTIENETNFDDDEIEEEEDFEEGIEEGLEEDEGDIENVVNETIVNQTEEDETEEIEINDTITNKTIEMDGEEESVNGIEGVLEINESLIRFAPPSFGTGDVPIIKVDVLKEKPEALDKAVFASGIHKTLKLNFATPGPVLNEEITKKGKNVKIVNPGIEIKDVLAFILIDKADVVSEDFIRVVDNAGKDVSNIEIIDEDTDWKIEWTIPVLAEGDNDYSIIVIVEAAHLDIDRIFLSDIFPEVSELDNIWSPVISDGEYVRVTFEIPLNSERDITVFPRIVSGTPRVEVFELDGTDLVAEFRNLETEEYNKVFLSGLSGEQDTFDLRVLDGEVEFDHIIDPDIAYVDGTETVAGGDVSSIVVNVPTHSEGDVMIAVIGESESEDGSIDTPTGWTSVQQLDVGQAPVSTPEAHVFYRVATASEPASYTWTYNAGANTAGMVGGIYVYRNVDTTGSPIGQTATSQSTANGCPTAPSVTTTETNEMVLYIGFTDDDRVPATETNYYPTSTTGREAHETPFGGNGMGLGVAEELRATAGATGTRDFQNCDTNDQWGAITISLLPTAAAGGGSPLVDAVSTGSMTSTAANVPLAISHTTATGDDNYMLVGVAINNFDFETVQSVTLLGNSFTKVGELNAQKAPGDDSRVEIWEMRNADLPEDGSPHDVIVIFDDDHEDFPGVDEGAVAGVISFTGVDQVNPLETQDADSFPFIAENSGESVSATLDVTSGTDQLAFAVGGCEFCNPISNDPGQTEHWAITEDKETGTGVSKAGASPTVNFQFDLPAIDDWVFGGVSIRGVSAGGGGGAEGDIVKRILDTTSSNFLNTGTVNYNDVAFVHTTHPNANFMLVSLAENPNSGSENELDGTGFGISTLTYGGQSFTKVSGSNEDSADERAHVEMWRLDNPPAGTHTVRAVFNTDADADVDNGAVMSTMTFHNVDLDAPFGTVVTGNGIDTNPSVTVSSAVDELVVGVAAQASGSGFDILDKMASVGGQVERWNRLAEEHNNGGIRISGTGVTEVGAGSVTLDWTAGNTESSSSYQWAAVAVPIQPEVIFPGITTAPVILDSVSEASIAGNILIPHTIPAGPLNRYLVVGTAQNDDSEDRVGKITFSGIPFTFIGLDDDGGGNKDIIVELWGLKNPPTGTHDVIVEYTNNSDSPDPDTALDRGAVAGSMAFEGVSQSGPIGVLESKGSNAGNPINLNNPVVSTTDEMIFNVVGCDDCTSFIVASGQFEEAELGVFGQTRGAFATAKGAASVLLDWTYDGNNWANIAVPLQAERIIFIPTVCSTSTIVLDQPGATYQVTSGDMQTSTDPCFRVTADGITLDLNGAEIRNDGTVGTGTAIELDLDANNFYLDGGGDRIKDYQYAIETKVRENSISEVDGSYIEIRDIQIEDDILNAGRGSPSTCVQSRGGHGGTVVWKDYSLLGGSFLSAGNEIDVTGGTCLTQDDDGGDGGKVNIMGTDVDISNVDIFVKHGDAQGLGIDGTNGRMVINYSTSFIDTGATYSDYLNFNIIKDGVAEVNGTTVGTDPQAFVDLDAIFTLTDNSVKVVTSAVSTLKDGMIVTFYNPTIGTFDPGQITVNRELGAFGAEVCPKTGGAFNCKDLTSLTGTTPSFQITEEDNGAGTYTYSIGDKTAPILTIIPPTPPEGSTVTPPVHLRLQTDDTAYVGGVSSDPEFRINGGAYQPLSQQGVQVWWDSNPAPVSPGSNTVEFKVQDEAGNTQVQSRTFTVDSEDITGCTTLSTPGNYFLSQDIIDATTDCIIIDSDRVSLNGANAAIEDFSGFESGTQSWVDGGANSFRSSAESFCDDTESAAGSWSWNLQDGTSSSSVSKIFTTLVGENTASIEWNANYQGLQSGDVMNIYCNGNEVYSFDMVSEIGAGSLGNWIGPTEGQHTMISPEECGLIVFDTSVEIRFETEFDGGSEDVFLDCVEVKSYDSTPFKVDGLNRPVGTEGIKVLGSVSDVEIHNIIVDEFAVGISLESSSSIMVSDVSLNNNDNGLQFVNNDNSVIRNANVQNSQTSGVLFIANSDNVLFDNLVSQNSIGSDFFYFDSFAGTPTIHMKDFTISTYSINPVSSTNRPKINFTQTGLGSIFFNSDTASERISGSVGDLNARIGIAFNSSSSSFDLPARVTIFGATVGFTDGGEIFEDGSVCDTTTPVCTYVDPASPPAPPISESQNGVVFNVAGFATSSTVYAIGDVPPSVVFGPGTTATDGSSVDLDVDIDITDLGTTYSFVDVSNDLRAWFRLEGNTLDSSTYGNDGTLNGVTGPNNLPQQDFGFFGDSYNFDHTDDFINIPDDGSLDLGDKDWTISAWVNPETFTQIDAIVTKHASAMDKEYGIMIEDGLLRVIIEKDNTNDVVKSTGSALTLNAWSHVAATFDADTKEIRLYVDGAIQPVECLLDGSPFACPFANVGSVSNLPDDFTAPLRIGLDHTTLRYFDGEIDEVLILARTLNDDEILALFDSKTNPLDTSLTSLPNGVYEITGHGVDRSGLSDTTSTRTNIFVGDPFVSDILNFGQVVSATNPPEIDIAGGQILDAVSLPFLSFDVEVTGVDGNNPPLNLDHVKAAITFPSGNRDDLDCDYNPASYSVATHSATFKCEFTINYYDDSGNHLIDAEVCLVPETTCTSTGIFIPALDNDRTIIMPSITYVEPINPSVGLQWGSIEAGGVDAVTTTPLEVENQGNTIADVQVKANDLQGSVTPSDIISINSGGFKMGTDSGTVCSSGIDLTNGVFSASIDANIPVGPPGPGARVSLHGCIQTVPTTLPVQSYVADAAHSNIWEVIFSVAALGALGNSARRRRKKRDFRKDPLFVAIVSVVRELHENYRESKAELLQRMITELSKTYGIGKKIIREKLVEERPLEIPTSVFSSDVGGLEALVRFLKENAQMSYSEIGLLLRRDERTVWNAYHKAVNKMKDRRLDLSSEVVVRLSDFIDDKMTVLECLIVSLRNLGISYVEIGELISRDQRNVWTIYDRAKKKLKK